MYCPRAQTFIIVYIYKAGGWESKFIPIIHWYPLSSHLPIQDHPCNWDQLLSGSPNNTSTLNQPNTETTARGIGYLARRFRTPSHFHLRRSDDISPITPRSYILLSCHVHCSGILMGLMYHGLSYTPRNSGKWRQAQPTERESFCVKVPHCQQLHGVGTMYRCHVTLVHAQYLVRC